MALRPEKTAHYHHGSLREALIQAAVRALNDGDEADFSLSSVARSLGVTPAAAYKHFSHKDDLMAEVAAFGFGQLAERFEAAAPRSKRPRSCRQAIDRFERLAQAYFEFGLSQPALFHVIFGWRGEAHRQAIVAVQGQTRTFGCLVQALKDLHAQAAISVEPNESWQWFAWSAIHGATELGIARVSNLVAPEEVAGVVTRSIISAMCSPISGSGSLHTEVIKPVRTSQHRSST
jgi:AcrR family transcriptional regulator